MCLIIMFQVMEPLVLAVLGFQVEKLALGLSLDFPLELVGILLTRCKVLWYRKVERNTKIYQYFSLCTGVGPGGISPAQAKAAKYGTTVIIKTVFSCQNK